MACVNCGADADYLLADPGANPLEYCNSCLPPHLRSRALAGHFPLPSDD